MPFLVREERLLNLIGSPYRRRSETIGGRAANGPLFNQAAKFRSSTAVYERKRSGRRNAIGKGPQMRQGFALDRDLCDLICERYRTQP